MVRVAGFELFLFLLLSFKVCYFFSIHLLFGTLFICLFPSFPHDINTVREK